MTRWLGPILLVFVAVLLVLRTTSAIEAARSLTDAFASAEDPGGGTYWHREPGVVPYARGGWGGNAHLGLTHYRIAEPQARNIVPDPWTHQGGEPYLDVLLTLDGLVRLREDTYSSWPYEGRGLSPEARDAVAARLEDLSQATAQSNRKWRLMRLNFDRFARWGLAGSVLSVAAESTAALRRVGFRVASPPHGRFLLLQADLDRVREADVRDDSGAALRVGMVAEGSIFERRVVVRMGEDVWRLPADPWGPSSSSGDGQSADPLEQANTAWASFDARLQSDARRAGHAIVSLPGPRGAVPVGHVVQVLDLLLGYGVLRVVFLDDGIALDLVPPPAPLDVLDPAPPEPTSVLPVPLALLTILGCAAVLALTLSGTVSRSWRAP